MVNTGDSIEFPIQKTVELVTVSRVLFLCCRKYDSKYFMCESTRFHNINLLQYNSLRLSLKVSTIQCVTFPEIWYSTAESPLMYRYRAVFFLCVCFFGIHVKEVYGSIKPQTLSPCMHCVFETTAPWLNRYHNNPDLFQQDSFFTYALQNAN